jgi:protocatechuate 3,4-dioxygenase alpha subunit
MSLRATTSQTIGPYLRIGLEWMVIEDLAPQGIAGERVRIEGRVLDGDGKPVNDAAVEIWQANSRGQYASPEDAQAKPIAQSFRGYGRSLTDNAGAFRVRTIKPGRVPGPDAKLHKQLQTRIYFPDDPANADDPVLNLIPAERRGTLIAKRRADGEFQWDVVLQGKNETVFFDF